MSIRNIKRRMRKIRIRKKIKGNRLKPRFCVFKSNRHLYAQIIDDGNGRTVLSASDLKTRKGSMKEKAKAVGEEIAKKCKAKKISKVVFDRGGYKYIGLIQILADAARANGLKF